MHVSVSDILTVVDDIDCYLPKNTVANIKACVCYFFKIFYFSPNESPSKTMKTCFLLDQKS